MLTVAVRRLRIAALFACALVVGAPGCNCGTKNDPCKNVICAAADACHIAGACDKTTGLCSTPPLPDGTSCSDGNRCNGEEVCTAGVCGARPGSAIACNSPGACQIAAGATCDPATGACTYHP